MLLPLNLNTRYYLVLPVSAEVLQRWRGEEEEDEVCTTHGVGGSTLTHTRGERVERGHGVVVGVQPGPSAGVLLLLLLHPRLCGHRGAAAHRGRGRC